MVRHFSSRWLAFSLSGNETETSSCHEGTSLAEQDTNLACRGKVYQYFSLKYTFMLAVFLFELGSLLAGEVSHSVGELISQLI